MADASQPTTPQRIMGMAWGFTAPLTLEAAIRNGVFDTLDQKPKTLAEISRDTGASQRGLRAIAIVADVDFARVDAERLHQMQCVVVRLMSGCKSRKREGKHIRAGQAQGVNRFDRDQQCLG